jgi:predicted nucleic acid-binding protein
MNVFDTNIIMEILFRREKVEVCTKLYQSLSDLAISPFTVNQLYYFCEKDKYDIFKLKNVIADFKILSFTEEVYLLAHKIGFTGDFEDTLQIATAIQNGAAKFYTLDTQLANKYSDLITIKVL